MNDLLRPRRCWKVAALCCALSAGCGSGSATKPGHDAGSRSDAGQHGGGAGADAAAPDAGKPMTGMSDAGPDAGSPEAGPDAAMVMDSGPPDHTPPKLVSSTPADGDDAVRWDTEPLLTFSEPVTAPDGAVHLLDDNTGDELAIELVPSADGRELTVHLLDPPSLPAALRLQLTSTLADLAGNPLAPVEIAFSMPVWRTLGDALNRSAGSSVSELALALDDMGRVLALFVEDGALFASRFDGGTWQALGGQLDATAALVTAGSGPSISLAVGADGEPLSAFRTSGGAVVVQRWDGSAWQALGPGPNDDGGGSYAPALGSNAAGEPVVVFDDVASGPIPVLRAYAWHDSAFQDLGPYTLDDLQGLRHATDPGGAIVLAYDTHGSSPGVHVLRFDGSAFTPLDSNPALPSPSADFAVGTASGSDVLLSAQGEGSTHWDGSGWQALSHDMAFLNSAHAADRIVVGAAGGAWLAAFRETPFGAANAHVYLERYDGTRFQPLGASLARTPGSDSSSPSLVRTAGDEPVVGWLETPAGGGPSQAYVNVYNGPSDRAPYGLPTRSYDADCLATVPADGSKLTDTGCFTDSVGRNPVAGFVPFDVKSPLWTDGAIKRRFFMLPPGTTITYRDPGIWTFPEGTIVLKEFQLEAKRGDASTLRPVETRFLVVRNTGNWDRYSFQWNQDATEAVLRPAKPAQNTFTFQIEDETGTSTTQTYFYPSRSDCLQCHQTPGTVLGPQTVMLNRNFEYGGTVDNQLRAMEHLGLFGDTFAAQDLGSAHVMPDPEDTTYPLERRLRSYLHSNCSSCHHGTALYWDARYEIPTYSATDVDSNLCTKIIPGDKANSLLYVRDVVGVDSSGNPVQMPPLGTLIHNPLLDQLESAWIADPQPCQAPFQSTPH